MSSSIAISVQFVAFLFFIQFINCHGDTSVVRATANGLGQEEDNSMELSESNRHGRTFFNANSLLDLMTRRRCPLCDSSVYTYCGDKLFHDSCCCSNSQQQQYPHNNPYGQLPYECQFADCSFLHSNSCAEHKLITACCCVNHLFK